MAAEPWFSASLSTTPGLSDYQQFISCQPPPGSGAIRAHKGYIRPFSCNEDARVVLRALEARIPLQVAGGRIGVEGANLQRHPFEGFLIDVAVPFTILVLEFVGTEHPRAFLLDPPMIPRLSMSPHLRFDRSIFVDGREVPALCIYAGNLFHFADDRSRLEQFLDQVSTYLARYLIWLRTRMLFRPSVVGVRQFVYRREPHEPVFPFDVLRSREVYWDGYWPGPSAPSGYAQHLATIRRDDECWCWSGKRYGECCRPKELEIVKKRNRR
jgi:hypothetical protein